MKVIRRLLLGVLALTVIAAVGGYLYYSRAVQTPVDPGASETIVFEVPKGATLNRIGRMLAAEGLTSSEFIWKLYTKLNSGAPSPKAGKHELSRSMNVPQLISAIAAKPISEDVPLTMVEGWRLRDADAFLAQKGLIEAGTYRSAAEHKGKFKVPFEIEGESLAGYLLPETYMIPPGKLDVAKLIQRQIDAFDQRYVQPHAEEIKRSKRSLRQIVIVASMLEREEPKEKNRPAVAGVMYKRLDSNTPLGIDATSRYTLDDWNDRSKFLAKLRDPSDPYNTRLRAGLPPGPIGAPGLPSLTSALRPKMGPYWYYLHDASQEIHFARTAAEHEANRKRYNVW